jgi:chromosome segregation ATPase
MEDSQSPSSRQRSKDDDGPFFFSASNSSSTGGNNNNNNNNNSMATVAARIQDRAMQLMSERATLEVVKTELEQIQTVANREQEENHSIRRTLLTTTRSRHGIELELFEARDQAENTTDSIDTLKQTTEEILEETAQAKLQWEDAVHKIYSTHQLEMDLYQRSLEGSVRKCEEQTNRRKERLQELEQKTDRLCREQESLVQETRSIQTEVEVIEQAEKHKDEQVSTLAEKVRTALAKVRAILYACKIESILLLVRADVFWIIYFYYSSCFSQSVPRRAKP